MSEHIFVDTNVFLRFFVRDNESFYHKAKILFEKAEKGEVKLKTNEMVIAEIVWVLESYYNFSRKEISEIIDIIIETKNIKVIGHEKVKEAVKLYSAGKMDFIDAYNIASINAEGCKKVATFDIKHFKNVDSITLIWQ